jgi:hypothetical protein
MEELQQLSHYLNRLVSDLRIKPVHLAVALAICQQWANNRGKLSFQISRRLIMGASHIRSKATYHRVVKDLRHWGYLRYKPSYHPKNASVITILLKSTPMQTALSEIDATDSINTQSHSDLNSPIKTTFGKENPIGRN